MSNVTNYYTPFLLKNKGVCFILFLGIKNITFFQNEFKNKNAFNNTGYFYYYPGRKYLYTA